MRDEERKREEQEGTKPLGKRSGRDGVRPESQPGEFADEMRVNRFEPPPEPETEHPKKQQ